MANLQIAELTTDNLFAAIQLPPQPPDKEPVAPVAWSVAEAYVNPTAWPRVVLDGDEVVGFVMWGVDPEDESFWIGGLVIDRRSQRRGYGRAVVARLLEQAAADGHREVALSYDPENTVARSLYASMGFVETGEISDNETVARRQLT